MLETQFNANVVSRHLIHLREDDYELVEVPYFKDEIEKMLELKLSKT